MFSTVFPQTTALNTVSDTKYNIRLSAYAYACTYIMHYRQSQSEDYQGLSY